MIPFQKIFTLVVRTFSKPVLSYLKQRQAENRMKNLRWIFVGIGRRQQIFEHWLNHKILKTTHKKQLNELKEEILLERGVEAVYELFLYCILIGLPMYELYTSAVSAQKKEKKLSENISEMQLQLKQLNQNLVKTITAIKYRGEYNEKLQKQRVQKIAEIKKKQLQLRRKEFRDYLVAKQNEQHERLNKLMSQSIVSQNQAKSQPQTETIDRETRTEQYSKPQSLIDPVQAQDAS